MTILSDFVGTWSGTNGFRLMPGDPLAEFPATATVAVAAGDHMTSITYTWEHPADGKQDGLLVVGSGSKDRSLVALWGDSWHQQPAPMSLSGSEAASKAVELEGEYGSGWRWRIVFVCDRTDRLRMRMDNVIPADQALTETPAAPYPAMIMDTRRA